MSRAVKFRAWDTKERKWLFGKDGFSMFGEMVIMGEWGNAAWRSISDDEPYRYQLLQYTGLKDKNGVEIYEGDIVDDRGVTWYVEFGNGNYTLRCTCHYPDGDFYVFEDSPFYAVIGNIYENPELLEGSH